MTHVLFESITLAEETMRDAALATLAAAHALSDVAIGWAGPPAYGVNAGHLLQRVEFADEAAYRRWRRDPFWDGEAAQGMARDTAIRDAIFYRRGNGSARGDDTPGIWRGLVFATRPNAPARDVAALETALLAMPRHIPALRGWRLSTAIEHHGSRAWSHMWEQELDSADDLRGVYLHHPYHWGHVDAWFDADCPEWIVDPRSIHCFAEAGRAIRL